MDWHLWLEIGASVGSTFIAFTVGVWKLSSLITRYESKQMARDLEQDRKIQMLHEAYERTTEWIETLRKRSEQFKEELSEIRVRTETERERSAEDRKALVEAVKDLSKTVHSMDKQIAEIHAIMSEQRGGGSGKGRGS